MRRPGARALRTGYACLTAVYALAGLLVLRATLVSGRVSHRHDAPGMILRRPWALVLLALIALALAGYALAQGVASVLMRGSSARARLRGAASCAVHGALAGLTIELLVHLCHPPSGAWTEQHWTARLMQGDYGGWAVGALGVGLLVAGALQLVRAHRVQGRPLFDTREMSPAAEQWTAIVAQAGIAARGAAMTLSGWFLARSAWIHGGETDRGLTPALASLHRSGFGPVTLGVLGLTLVLYAAFAALRVRYGPPPRAE